MIRSKKCKNCQDKFHPYTSFQKYCTKEECLSVFWKENKAKEEKKRQKQRKEELMTLQDYLKIAQQVFNKYIRERDKHQPCISCNKPLGSKFDAGHFFNANNHWAVRFDERNVHAQCVYCNQHLHGNLLEYRKQLEFYYGFFWLSELEKDAKKTRKFTKEELKNIIEIYKNKIKELH
jgi:hypothetical protein